MRRTFSASVWLREPLGHGGSALAAMAALVLSACTGIVDAGGGSPGSGPGGSSIAGPGVGPEACEGSEIAAPKRIVRLSFNQIANAVRSLTNDAQAQSIAATYEIGDSLHRTFPPLSSPREGSTVTDKTWATGDKIASAVGKYVFDNLATATDCGAAPSDECARAFVLGFAERAFRRPLGEEEKTSLLKVLSDVAAVGGTPAQAIQYGVYAALEAPQFLYRTELGDVATSEGPLTPYELANQLAFFLTDAPPDQQLLDAAASGALATPEQIALHVRRVLGTPSAKANLEAAIFSYFGLTGMENVIVDSVDLTPALRNSMSREAQLFLSNNLWSGGLPQLLTTRKSNINSTLAPLYGVTAFPPPGASLDADGFALTELPETRAGILTQAAFLTARSRPDQPSVVGRGLLVNAALLCAKNPEFPKELAEEIKAVSATQTELTERQKAEYRAQTPRCQGCHQGFDPYGLALGNFDSLGRWMPADALGRPIDATVKLPELAGGKEVKTAAELADALAGGGGFTTCMAKNLLLYALAEPPAGETSVASVRVTGCATRAIAEQLGKTDQSFSQLIEKVALSQTLARRSAGQGAP